MAIEDATLIARLRIRATIRRQIPGRLSVQEGRPDRIADLLDEAADEIERLNGLIYKERVERVEMSNMKIGWLFIQAGILVLMFAAVLPLLVSAKSTIAFGLGVSGIIVCTGWLIHLGESIYKFVTTS